MPSLVTPDLQAARLRWGWLWIGLGVLITSAVFGATLGPAGLDSWQVIREFGGAVLFIDDPSTLTATERAILWELRVPRVVLGGLVGAMLSVAGASYQGVFRNPLADPYLLGVAAGAGLGATIVIAYVLNPGEGLLPIAAFAGAIVAVAAAYAVGRSVGGRSSLTLILAGIAMASFFTALQTYLQQRNAETIRQVYTWILGRLATARVGRSPHPASLRLGVRDRAHTSPSTPRRHERRRCRGGQSGHFVNKSQGDRGYLCDARDRRCSSRQWADRVCRHCCTAHGATHGGTQLSVAHTSVPDLRSCVPHPRRPRRPNDRGSPAELPIGVITAFIGAPFFIFVLRTSRRSIG